MDIGSHCSVGACSQVDFLPFTCDCCRSVFCLAHRTYDAHECPLAGSKDRRVLDCPLCGALLHWTSEQDVDAVWARHVQGGACNGTTSTSTSSDVLAKKAKKKKPRCDAAGCREVLTASNQFACTKCRQNVCLKHRFESDHGCESARRTARQRQWGLPTAQQSARTAAATVASGARSAVNSLVQNARAAAASANANAVTTASEECPMCQQKFAYVAQLIAHVNKAHPDPLRRGASAASAASSSPAVATAAAAASGREVCPQCRAEFRDLDALIRHAESAHAAAVAAAASGAGGGRRDQEKCSVM